MAVLVGIDEAGYGPILGPLVVAAACFELPDNLLDNRCSLWQTLAASVTRRRAGAAGRLVINDSKKLHRTGDYRTLQRGVLATLLAAAANNQPDAPSQPAQPPANLSELLTLLAAYEPTVLADYPWYARAAADHPIAADRDDLQTVAADLAADLAAHRMSAAGLSARVLPEGHFNRLVQALDNKAAVLFHLVCRLIDAAFRRFPRRRLQVVVDKQSGRNHYRQPLQLMFPGLQMKILREDDLTSSYHLAGPAGALKIHFLQKGEQRQLPIALASMTAKYVRELFMELLNAYFRRHLPDLSPTAGYYTDGARFLADLHRRGIDRSLAPRDLLVRSR